MAAEMQQQPKMTIMTQQMTRGACGLVRLIPILKPNQLDQTQLIWMKMRRKCCLKHVLAWPTPGDLLCTIVKILKESSFEENAPNIILVINNMLVILFACTLDSARK